MAALALVSGCATAPSSETALEAGTPGHLVLGHEVRSFSPCENNIPLWLSGDPVLLAALVTRQRELIDDPYGETFARLVGTPGPKLSCAFCRGYPGSFEVTRVLEQRAATADDCAP